MTSFYDWYADLPVASPQVFGDQTDVPESGDWWDSTYLMMWGSNVPVTRTPDAHWMAEVRYRGTKVVTVSPDYADNVKFADEWLPAQAGTDGALAMAMGHVMLKENYVDRQVPFFTDYVTKYTDLSMLVTLVDHPDGHGLTASKFLTAADLPALSATSDADLQDRAVGQRHRRAGRTQRHDGPPLQRRGRRQVEPRPGRARPGAEPPRRRRRHPGRDRPPLLRGPPRRRVDHPPRRPGGTCRRAPRHHRPRPDAGAVRRGPRRAARPVGRRLRRRHHPVHAGLAGRDHERPGGRLHPDRARVREELRRLGRPVDDHPRRRHLPLVPRRRHVPRDHGAAHAHRLHRSQRRRLGALRRPGEVPADDGLVQPRQRARLVASAADDDRHRLLVHAHRPVAYRRLLGRPREVAAVDRLARRPPHRGRHGALAPPRLDAVLPAVRPQPARPRRRGQGRRRARGGRVGRRVGRRASSSPAR